MPQTREHFDICRLLRVPAGLVVLTKSDLADADTLEIAGLDVRELGRRIVPGRRAHRGRVRERRARGLDALRAALLDVSRRVRVVTRKAPRVCPSIACFSMKGFGTVITGTLTFRRVGARCGTGHRAGRPPRQGARHPGACEKRVEANRGGAHGINLAGVELEDVSRGQTLITPAAFEETRVADVNRRTAARCETAEARRARPVSSGDGGDPRTRVAPSAPRRPRRTIARLKGSRSSLEHARSRGCVWNRRNPRARRPLHPACVFAVDDDRRGTDSGSVSAAHGDSHGGRPGAMRAAGVRSGVERSCRRRPTRGRRDGRGMQAMRDSRSPR